MPRLRNTTEFQTGEEVLRVDCLGNLVDNMRDNIVVAHEDVPAFIMWLSREHKRVKSFGLVTEKSRD